MLTISKAQVEAFKPIALSDFEASMVDHGARFSPKLAAVLGKEHLLVVVQTAVKRAALHGFTFTGPVRLFIELGFLFGSSFDVDPQYPWAREALGEPDPDTQMARAQELHTASIEALDSINGPDDAFLDAAFHNLQALGEDMPQIRPEEVPAVALSAMAQIHPEKAAHVGEAALRSLIAAGEAEAKRHGLYDGHDILVLVMLMFAFGQGCTADPLYPWIERTLGSDKITDPVRRARQLKQKALTWVRAVIKNKQSDG
ncbi:hypothetical protein [Chondromyces apiculatus]|uniref:Uncharacterized protein n=1 Tax=Chondromyces apiculatus DSM 436 TaxID=1192034 RepID=A0A017SZ05_9BACT|nr:hypothetical protein [Chondromyces apiculatus]EYF01845.1 Hypothetical protein CAP_7726 [Chondromyces apiculatus DSM 436]